MNREQLAAAAQALGAPEELVARSAQARAHAQGVSVDEVLAAWAGGAGVPAAAAAPPAAAAPVEPPSEPAPVEPAAVEQPAAAAVPLPSEQPVAAGSAPPAGAVAVATAPPPAVARPTAIPTLTGRHESHLALLLGVLSLFVLGFTFSFLLPAFDAASAGGATPALSEQALEGRDVYLREGCWYCHTQMVRPVVTDVGLGAVSDPAAVDYRPDTLGVQRIGPDLAHVGGREETSDPAWLAAYLVDPQSVRPGTLQPSYAHLPEAEVAALAQFLAESR